MKKKLFVGLGVAILAIAVIGGSVALAAGPGGQAYGRMAEQGFVDEDGDGVCDLCGQTEPGTLSDGMAQGFRGRGAGRDAAWQEINLVSVVAESLGLTVEQVHVELAEGKTLAQVVDAHGGSVEQVVDAYVAARVAILDQWVAEGRITQAQADVMQEHIAAEAQEHLNEQGICGYGGTTLQNGTGRGGRLTSPTTQGRMGRGRSW